MNLTLVNPVATSQSASDFALRQASYDRLHHLRRIQWLNQENPCYSCGTPVPDSEKLILLELSRLTVKLPSMAHNHCDINDSDYVAVLDEFAIQNGL